MKNMRNMKMFWGAALCLAAGCTSGPPPPVQDTGAYARTVESERAVGGGNRRVLVDAKYHVPASLAEAEFNPPVVIELQTSGAERRRMRKAGSLNFTVAGSPLTLTAFADVDARVPTSLFVPFGDRTSGDTTYKGGRYLDLKRTPTGFYELDFNRAYHPYCVYNPSYVCPVPPRENRLAAAILAGERLPAAK